MPIFEYRALDVQGQTVQGTLQSGSLMTAAADLEGQGLTVQHVGLAQSPPLRPGERGPGGEVARDITSQRSYLQTHVVGQVFKVPLKDLAFLFRSLTSIQKAGIGLAAGLESIGRQQRDPLLRKIVNEMRQHALEGRPLSFGMQRYPEAFSPLIVSLVRTGEESGMLDHTLPLIAEYIDKEIKLRNLIRRLTLYPKIVLFASIIIIMGANSIIGMFSGKALWSPLTELSTWLCLAPTLLAIFAFVKFVLPNPAFRARWDAFLVHLPYVGNTIHMLAMAKFGRAFGALYRGGVPVHRATRLAADACGNEHIRARIYPVSPMLERGSSIYETFRDSGVMDPLVLDMMKTGEETGNMDHMLEKMADFFEDEAEVRSTVAANVLGVVTFLAVAIYVGIVIVTFYTGYFGGLVDAAGG